MDWCKIGRQAKKQGIRGKNESEETEKAEEANEKKK